MRANALESYIASERSDPFVRDRVMTHVALGISGYEAEEFREPRVFVNQAGERVEYTVPAFRNIKRP